MQQYNIKINELAEQDLENAGDYIAYILLNPIAAVDSRAWLYNTFDIDN